MKVIQLTAENVKKIKVIDITPKTDFIEVTGKNGSGKTSVLDCIFWALAGGKVIQDQPIRQGEQKAVIKLNLGEVIVTRRFTPSGSTLVVENAAGFRANKPQDLLDEIYGYLTFDPFEFSRMPAGDQFDVLKDVAGVTVDFDALQAAEKADMDARRDHNRDLRQLEAQLAALPQRDDAPAARVDIDKTLRRLDEAEAFNRDIENLQRQKQEKETLLRGHHGRIEALQAEIKTIEGYVKKVEAELESMQAPQPLVDTTFIRAEISGATAKNVAFDQVQARNKLAGQVEAKRAEADALTSAIEQRRAEARDVIAKAQMPVPGLSLGDKSVMFNDTPFAQLSTAEQIRVSVAIAMAANPKLRVIRIKDGSLLDDDALQIIRDMARERDYQVWCERVDSSGMIGIVMQDGEVAANHEGENNG